MEGIYKHLFPALFKLGCDIEQVRVHLEIIFYEVYHFHNICIYFNNISIRIEHRLATLTHVLMSIS